MINWQIKRFAKFIKVQIILFNTTLCTSSHKELLHENRNKFIEKLFKGFSILRLTFHPQQPCHVFWRQFSFQDTRIEGGYENVPTRDIHMKQVGFEEQWLNILNTYVRPLQEKVFLGYISDVGKVFDF